MRNPIHLFLSRRIVLNRRTGAWRSVWLSFALGLLVIAGATGCRHAEARALPEIPLEMPSPPARVVEVIDPQAPAIVSLPEEPVTNPPSRRVTPPARTEVRPPEPRPEVPADIPRVEDTGRPPVTPTPTLQTAPPQQETETERRVKAQLNQANAALGRINAQSLNSEARQQLETARGFVRQAEEAIRVRNFVFASSLLDKAQSIALQLSGR